MLGILLIHTHLLLTANRYFNRLIMIMNVRLTSHVLQISQIPGKTTESDTNGISETNLATFLMATSPPSARSCSGGFSAFINLDTNTVFPLMSTTVALYSLLGYLAFSSFTYFSAAAWISSLSLVSNYEIQNIGLKSELNW